MNRPAPLDQIGIRTPSRLHFGLIGWGIPARRPFGGVGLSIEDPGIHLTIERADTWKSEGPGSHRALTIAREVAAQIASRARAVSPLWIRVREAPPQHVGLGVGTQLSLAVARGVANLAGLAELDTSELALMTGRGLRSGVGIHAFDHGGLIFDAGRLDESAIPARIARLELPHGWKILIVSPVNEVGIHGPRERAAFSQLPAPEETESNAVCRLIACELLTAVIEQDLTRFGTVLDEIQAVVGNWFAPAQGGRFASDLITKNVARMRSAGLVGVGQSSWGPTLYGFSNADERTRARIRRDLRLVAGLAEEEVYWTQADHRGARWVC